MSLQQNDFKEISSLALAHIRSLASDLLPGGKMRGNEWVAGSVTGGQGDSCSLNLNSGKWADFATDEKGGDLISLYAAHHRCSQLDAMKALAKKIGYKFKQNNYKSAHAPTPHTPQVTSRQPDEIPFNLVPIPLEVQEPNFFHAQHGSPEGTWCYYDEGGGRLFWIARYKSKDGGKQFIPFSWCSNRGRIVSKAWDGPRPLYGLEKLADESQAVLIVEGEKTCEAARRFLNPKTYTVVSWSGGAKAFEKTDWTPLRGRKIVLWPDNDRKVIKTETQSAKYGLAVGEMIPLDEQPGFSAMMGIAAILAPYCEIKYFSLHEYPAIGEIDGFDAADAENMAWTAQIFKNTVLPFVKTYELPPVITPPELEEVAETEWVQGNIYSELNNCGLIQKIGSSEFHLNISNMVALISNHRNLKGRIWFDEFHLRTFTTWRTEKPVQWIDGDDLELTAIFQRVFEMHKLEVGTVREAVRLYAHKNRKNEPRDWMSSLVWDKKERCHDFFINACQSENDEYTRTVSKNFWVAMAARVFVPGCKMDNMVILEGRQGAQKSTLLEEIAKEWFTECTEAVGSKDFKSLLSGHLIVEIPELTSLLKAHNQQDIKAALSDRADKYRPSYGRHEILFNRTCVFVGTTNDGEYLADPTGARRYWPIYVNKVDIDYVRNNRDQLFAEAVWRFRENKESWWMVPESAAKEMQETKRVIDPWEEKIEDWLYGAAGYQDRFRMSIVFDLLEIPVHQQRKQDKDRIKHILEIKGYVCKPTRHDGKIERRWCKEYSSTSQV